MKILSFLLLLDFSGSMDQSLDQSTKLQVLKQETSALMMTVQPKQQVGAFVFGTNAKLGCQDLHYLEAPATGMGGKIRSLKAGSFGRTPLSLGLDKLVRAANQNPSAVVIAVTDGGDTCGADPCKTLERLDKIVKRKIQIELVGYDIQQKDQGNFACFKKLNLKNIEINLTDARSAKDLQNLFINGQRKGLGLALDPESPKQSVPGINGATQQSINSNDSSLSPNSKTAKNKNQKNQGSKDNEAYLEVTGAPSSEEFIATENSRDLLRWKGSYLATLKPGKSKIKYNNTNGLELEIELPAGTVTRVPWARFMKNSVSSVALQKPFVNLHWTPEPSTVDIHGEVAAVDTSTDLQSNQSIVPNLPFGEWSVEVTSPPWLKGKVPTKKMQINLQEENSIEFEQIYAEFVDWIENPHPESDSVLTFSGDAKTQDRYLVPRGQKRVPIPKGAKVELILPTKDSSSKPKL